MGTRGVAWRRVCPDGVTRQLEEVTRITLYIVHQTGPTGFILKEDGARKKLKVFLGDPHTCTCATFKKTRELCIHILWVLLKKFRIPQANPVIWQLGLVEREICEILRGYLSRQSPTPSKNHTPTSRQVQIPQRVIGPDDVCPICQDDLIGSVRSVTYCRYGCGKSVHVKCMKIWSDHQKSLSEATLQCPLCREDFGSIVNLTETRVSRLTGSDPQHQHLGVVCSHCHVCPVMGKCYQCCVCADYHLCHACFSDRTHNMHPFQFRQHSSQPWRPAVPRLIPGPSLSSSSSSHPPAPSLISSLQSRSLTEEDYDLLLRLDNSQATPPPPPQRSRPCRVGVSERRIASMHVEPLDRHHPLVVGGARCQICQQIYFHGDWIRKLPCHHKFHRSCADSWLSVHTTCPVDQQPICGLRHTNHTPHVHPSGNAPRRIKAPLTRARLRRGVARSHDHQSPEFSVLGQGIQGGACLHGNSPKGLSTLNATPTFPLTGKLKPYLTSMAIAPCGGRPHPPQGPAPSLNDDHFGGQSLSQVRNQVNGRLRKGQFVSGGVARKKKSGLKLWSELATNLSVNGNHRPHPLTPPSHTPQPHPMAIPHNHTPQPHPHMHNYLV